MTSQSLSSAFTSLDNNRAAAIIGRFGTSRILIWLLRYMRDSAYPAAGRLACGEAAQACICSACCASSWPRPLPGRRAAAAPGFPASQPAPGAAPCPAAAPRRGCPPDNAPVPTEYAQTVVQLHSSTRYELLLQHNLLTTLAAARIAQPKQWGACFMQQVALQARLIRADRVEQDGRRLGQDDVAVVGPRQACAPQQ